MAYVFSLFVVFLIAALVYSATRGNGRNPKQRRNKASDSGFFFSGDNDCAKVSQSDFGDSGNSGGGDGGGGE